MRLKKRKKSLPASRRIAKFLAVKPRISPRAFVAPGVQLIGKVEIGSGSSIWYGSVLRADIHSIRIGRETNIQDGCIGHVESERGLVIGNQVTVGHGVQLHACRVEDGVLVGMGAIVLNGAHIGRQAQVAAGALVPEGMRVPPKTLVMGIPARIVRRLTSAEVLQNRHWAKKYAHLAGEYKRFQS